VLSDDQTFKDPHEATDAMIHAFGEIRRASGVAEQTTVGTAMAPSSAVG
jgi:diacylglycerol O-acyltransferase